ADEARHVEVYQRYLEKIGIAYPVAPYLHQLLDDVVSHRHVDMTFLGMQILVEGVALAAFSMGGAMFGNPVIGQITDLVRRDEARHVAFGVLSLQGFYDDMDPVDLAEREEFILEACSLMRDRFVPVEVYERLGIDAARAAAEYDSSPHMAAFRSLMFSNAVPHLGALAGVEPARIRINVTGIDDGDWVVRLAPEGITYAATTEATPADVTLSMDVATWTDIIAGRVTAPAAVMDGRVALEGDVMKALALDALL